MASIRRNGSKWRAQVYVQGVRDSDTFNTRQEASAWAVEREAQLSGRKLPHKTLSAAMKRYVDEVAPGHRGERWERIRIAAMQKWPIASRQLAGLSAQDFSSWRDARLKQVKPGTVAREMNLLRSVLENARSQWHWIKVNPMTDVSWPKVPSGRKRRLAPAEVTAIAKAFGVDKKLQASTATQRVGLAFLFALETAMRSGEILGLKPENVHLKAQYVSLPMTKNGDPRDVPLSKRAVEILKALPADTLFGMDGAMRDALWRKTRPESLNMIHFHDTRAEAIWRLSKKLDVLQLGRMIGHRDPKSLMIYYNESASDMAKRLG